MARRKPAKKTRKKPLPKRKEKKAARRAPAKKPAPKKAPKEIVITDELRRIWLRVRRAWNLSLTAFSNTLSLLSDREAELLYELVRHSLYKDSYVEILREHPELHKILRSDDDRLCMYDIYEILSWRLGKSEPPPEDVAVKMKMKGRIGRGFPRSLY